MGRDNNEGRSGSMKFMLMMNGPKGDGNWGVTNWAPQDFKAMVGFMKNFAKRLKEAGELVDAQGLAAPTQAKLVRAGKSGVPEVTDGPFAEAKEFLAGYWIVDCETTQRAYEIAARGSGAPARGGKPLNMPIEVREVMSGPPVEV